MILRTSESPSDYSELLTTFIIVLIIFLLITVVYAISIQCTKMYRRRHNAQELRIAISGKNRAKITDEKDLKYLEDLSFKFDRYSKAWWYNNSPFYFFKFRKAQKIFKKYEIDTTIFDKDLLPNNKDN